MATALETATLIEASDLGDGRSSTIYRSPDVQGVLFKRVNGIWLAGDGTDQEAQFRHNVGRDLDLLQDPANGLSEFIPPTELVWRKDIDGTYAGFLATREVIGAGLPLITNMNEEQAAQLDTLFGHGIMLGVRHSSSYFPQQPDLVDFEGELKSNVVMGAIVDGKTQFWHVDAYPALVVALVPRSAWDYAFRMLIDKANGYPFPRTQAALETFFA